MSRSPAHPALALLDILHESAREKADLLAEEFGIARLARESLPAFLRRLDHQMGQAAVMARVHALLTGLAHERGGSDKLV